VPSLWADPARWDMPPPTAVLWKNFGGLGRNFSYDNLVTFFALDEDLDPPDDVAIFPFGCLLGCGGWEGTPSKLIVGICRPRRQFYGKISEDLVEISHTITSSRSLALARFSEFRQTSVLVAF
jgi:hypothetical protein